MEDKNSALLQAPAKNSSVVPTPKMRGEVLVIITGGTICMQPSVAGALDQEGLSCRSLEQYLRSQNDLQDPSLPFYDILEWGNLVDSSDINQTHWKKMVEQIHENYDRYKGFVILHGTDTLAYTASALSFMLRNIGKPVVITGAMLPIYLPHTDARRNFAVSLWAATSPMIPEVVVVFGGKIFRGCRTAKVDCGQAEAFDSPNAICLGKINLAVVMVSSPLPPPKRAFEPTYGMAADRVTVFKVTPGFPSFLFRAIAATKERPFGVILELFGTGTAAAENEDFVTDLRFAIHDGVTFVAVTQCLRGTCSLKTYGNGQKLHDIGVIEGKDMTTEAASMKLAYLFSQGYKGEKLRMLMETPLVGELSEVVSLITGQASLKTSNLTTSSQGLEETDIEQDLEMLGQRREVAIYPPAHVDEKRDRRDTLVENIRGVLAPHNSHYPNDV